MPTPWVKRLSTHSAFLILCLKTFCVLSQFDRTRFEIAVFKIYCECCCERICHHDNLSKQALLCAVCFEFISEIDRVSCQGLFSGLHRFDSLQFNFHVTLIVLSLPADPFDS